jgi:hypothetical protein
MRTQDTSVSPGLAAASASIALPESLSDSVTVPAAKVFPAFDVDEVKVAYA